MNDWFNILDVHQRYSLRNLIIVWEIYMKAKKRVKLFAYYLRKGGISGASIYVKTVAERAKNELCIKSWGGHEIIILLILEIVSKIKLTI